MVGRRTQQTLVTMVQQSPAPASHVQGDSAAGTHSNLHDLASLTRCWTAAVNKTMTRSLCHLSAENSFLPRCDVVSLGGQFPLLQRITIVTPLTESSNLWISCPWWHSMKFKKNWILANTTMRTSNLASSECRRHSNVTVSTNFGGAYGDTAEHIVCCFNWSVVSTACNDRTEVTSVIFIQYKYAHN